MHSLRWWEPLMHFHGTPLAAEDDPMVYWRIKSQGNEAARQEFLDGYVPQIRELGLDVPDPKLRKNDAGVWEYTQPDWEKLQGGRVGARAWIRREARLQAGNVAPRSTGSRRRSSRRAA